MEINRSGMFPAPMMSIGMMYKNNGQPPQSTAQPDPAPRDSVTISDEARQYHQGQMLPGTSVKSLFDRFAGYDNSAAVETAQKNIDSNMLIFNRMELNGELDFSTWTKLDSVPQMTRVDPAEIKQNRAESIDAWIRGESAFNLSWATDSTAKSASGFSFVPNEHAQQVINDALQARRNGFDSLEGIAAAQEAAKKVAELTPNDFAWTDRTGLGGLTLDERDEFRAGMAEVFAHEGIDSDASKLGLLYSYEDDVDMIDAPGVSKENSARITSMLAGDEEVPVSDSILAVVERLRELYSKAQRVPY